MDFLDELKPVDPFHPEIGDDEVEIAFQRQFQAGVSILRPDRPVRNGRAENFLIDGRHARIVFDD